MAPAASVKSRYPRKNIMDLMVIMVPLCIIIPWIVLHLHYQLPEPVVEQYHPKTGAAQLSEAYMMEVARYLSEDIGYRTVGTREHALSDDWMAERLAELKQLCDIEADKEGRAPLECEVWRQQGDGKHRFDIAFHRVYKSYQGLTNHIFRMSSGKPSAKEHAVLINAHIDSTLPSPGAADDALCVGVMLELIRVMIKNGWSGEWSVVFLFNNAEESLQDASHLFSTQHDLAGSIRAVINLEAAGTTGPELLFQATSEEMIAAYKHVPHPQGSVLHNDVFNSGIILSDTDFGQFQRYLNVTGLDMAIVGNSYLYHTRKDTVENIQPGLPQHMSENVLALINHLTAPGSPLPHLTDYTKPATVYYSLLSKFFITYSYDLALLMSVSLLVWAVGLTLVTTREWSAIPRAYVGVIGGMFGALISANLVAVIISYVLRKPLSWFSREWLPIALYGPPALLGAMFVQLLVHPPPSRPPIEHQSLTSLTVFYAFVAAAGQYAGIGTSFAYFLASASLWIATVVNEVLVRVLEHEPGDVNHWTYAIGSAVPLLVGAEALCGFVDIFVPLTGRMGRDAPADIIIATAVSFLVFYMVPFVLPFSHRFGRRALKNICLGLLGLTLTVMAIFASPTWREFDQMHQNRYFVVHTENITSNDYGLHVATLSGASGFQSVVNALAEDFPEVTVKPRPATALGDKLAWDVFHPISEFVASYSMDLAPPEGYTSKYKNRFTVHALDALVDESAGTRTFTLHVDHPGLIWTVLSFQAEVLSWDLPDVPVEGFALHKIKEASYYMADQWSVRMTINQTSPMLVNFIGIQEDGMWPAKQGQGHGPNMELFQRIDKWLDVKTESSVDVSMFGCVAGALHV